MKVAVNVDCGRHIDAKTLRRVCMKVLKEEGVRRDAVISLSAVTGDRIGELNRRYLSRDGFTDVMAFPMGEECKEGFLLGDVIFCPEVIEARKGSYDVEEGRELEFVAVHGVLHLLGYDDDDEESALRMDHRQRQILGLPEGRAE